MRFPKMITISAAVTATAVLAAGGIAMAAPASTGQPSPATGMMGGDVDHMPAGTGPGTSQMDQMHTGDAAWMDEMHAEGRMDGDLEAMHGQTDAMHGDAEQMQQHHARMIERDPQLQQRHDEMTERYPEMREHMDAADPVRGPRG